MATLNCGKCQSFDLSPTWDRVNLFIYNIIPFLIMITFNCLLVKNIYSAKKSSEKYKTNSNTNSPRSLSKTNRLTISLLFLTFLFLVMTMPATILFAYFYDFIAANFSPTLMVLLDDISFLNHSTLFFVCLISNAKFRRVLWALVMNKCFGRAQQNTSNSTISQNRTIGVTKN